MNRLYHRILEERAWDETFIVAFKAAQEAWLAYREAEHDAQFPPPQTNVRDGSVYPMCAASFAEAMIRQRIERLREWIDGEPEGNVCSGSVPVR
jgi:uncharacterized protein YecT (DUF1311 family)